MQLGKYEKGSLSYDNMRSSEKNQEKFYLPHSCDEWIIGDIEDFQNLIDDFNKIVKKLQFDD